MTTEIKYNTVDNLIDICQEDPQKNKRKPMFFFRKKWIATMHSPQLLLYPCRTTHTVTASAYTAFCLTIKSFCCPGQFLRAPLPDLPDTMQPLCDGKNIPPFY